MANARHSPYEGLPAKCYWRTGVAERAPLDPGQLYTPKFPVSRKLRVVTAGSCFAQHVGRALRGAGLNVVDTEPLPAGLPAALTADYGFNLFSARYGNIYTAAQLLQLYREAFGLKAPTDPVWMRDGRHFDSQRPAIEPRGHATADDVLRHRAHHLAQVRKAFAQADLFVFTFGLTEAWRDAETGTVFPTAPGTVAGTYDPDRHRFHNYTVAEVLGDFRAFMKLMRGLNPKVRFLVTVSPVPLTATASGEHVEVATSYSKAVLRAACGTLAAEDPRVDYFPSYEIITSLNNRGAYFEANRRSVSDAGVHAAMQMFLDAHGLIPVGVPATEAAADDDPVRCEEALLEAFAR
ncbi:MAG: GSCFA family protein [Rhodobacteraceae bacterium]|nr:GSCFA family protein [Paracoccaceae bacterium]